MAQITEPQRIELIRGLLQDVQKMPPERHEVERLPWTAGEALLCEVIKIGVHDVLLNHRSHRVRAQLDGDPEWAELRNDPYSESAQSLIERHVRAVRKPEEFAALKDSLEREGQTHPGVMTHKGVLVNANTRAVALRDLEDPNKHYIRVAVLPPTAQPSELALLELRLQMQKELKVDYTFTNELLFIEELSSERHLTNAQIARELRIFPESERKGAAEVGLRLRMLDLLRDLQRIPSEGLALTFFDRIKYEQLRELFRTYDELLERDPNQARAHLECFLLSIAVDVTSVHQIRQVDAKFVTDYMLPRLEEDEVIGGVAERLTAGDDSSAAQMPSGASELVVKPDRQDEHVVDLKRLIDAVTQRDKRVEIPGSAMVIESDDVREAVNSAYITAIKDKRRDVRVADKLEAPLEAVRAASRDLIKAIDALRVIETDPDFDQRRRKSLEAQYNKLRRGMRNLETALTNARVIGA